MGTKSAQVVEDAAGFERLRDPWGRLLEASPSDCIFLTWEWLFTWWKHFSAGSKLAIVTAREGEDLIAVAPLSLAPPRLGYLSPFRSFELLGSGSVGSDYLDVIVKRGSEREALVPLCDHLRAKKLSLDLRQLKQFSMSAELATLLAKRRGWSVVETKTEICPFITLTGQSWQSYLSSLGSKHRYNFQRRLKNLDKQFAVRFEPARTEEERREALSILIALHHMRWQDRGGSDGLHNSALLSFHEEFSRLALERGWLRLFVLRLDGKPAAALYGFRYGRVFYFFQSGFDPLYAKHSVGLVAMGLAIRSALEEGAEEYDLLHGNEDYKFQWARQTRDLFRLEIYPTNAWGRIHRRAVELDRTTKQIARRVLPKRLAERIAAVRRTGTWKGFYAAQSR
jgi:CelD/BcsL family acetyltransferase involved in cellulose biosynthesis